MLGKRLPVQELIADQFASFSEFALPSGTRMQHQRLLYCSKCKICAIYPEIRFRDPSPLDLRALAISRVKLDPKTELPIPGHFRSRPPCATPCDMELCLASYHRYELKAIGQFALQFSMSSSSSTRGARLLPFAEARL